MDRTEATDLLGRELASYATRPFGELVTLIGRTDAYDVRADSGVLYQVEMTVDWDDEEGGPLRLAASIDDGTFRASFRPLTDDVLIVPPSLAEPMLSDGIGRIDDPLIERLEATGVEFEIIPCDPDLADTARFCEAYGYALEDSANTIIVTGKVDPPVNAACVVLATTRLDVNTVVRKRLGVRKASFASADETRALTGMAIGGVTPIGLPSSLPLWVDARVMERARIILGGGGRDRKVHAPPTLLIALGAEVVDGLAKDQPG